MNKPLLSLKTVPLALQACKAKLGFVEPAPDRSPKSYGYDNGPPAPSGLDHAHMRTGRVVTTSIRDAEPSGNYLERQNAMLLSELQIEQHAVGKATGGVPNKIAKEVGAQYETDSEREAAAAFAHSHRLSIAHAFSRRIVRSAVVMALVELYQASKVSPTGAPDTPG